MEETENNEEQEQLEDTKVNSHQETATNDQEIWSWGAGTEGQLGTGKLNDEYTPQLLHNLTNSLSNYGTVSTLSCGGAHVIALTSGGKVLTWGRGASGQLGHGQVVSNCLNPKLVDCLSSFNICQVSAGWNHSGFVSDSGSLFTCGDGSFGQLGHGDCQSCSTPTEVSFFSSKHVEQVACGMRHTLVQTKGNSGDQLYGFGSNNRGQLGVSKNKIRSVSIPQPCLEFDSAQVVTVIANGDHSAAISGEGKVSMLGGRHHGTLSEPENTAPDHNSFVNSVRFLQDSENAENPKLQEVAGLDGRRAVQIAAGAEHSAVVTDDGEIWTWGWGEHGQLGLGNTNDQTLPQLVPLQNANQHKSLTSRVYCGSGFTFAVRTHLQVDEDSNNNDNIRAIPK
ncbi:ultraviolet-B receptor UVR8 isoform X4 [Silene latifolia]|uniref:ultraviolet-B receptor UVR8 isoform X4 n=1 Tax=Silene latifolia TaxID=37657 RepID=UPI003D77AEC3